MQIEINNYWCVKISGYTTIFLRQFFKEGQFCDYTVKNIRRLYQQPTARTCIVIFTGTRKNCLARQDRKEQGGVTDISCNNLNRPTSTLSYIHIPIKVLRASVKVTLNALAAGCQSFCHFTVKSTDIFTMYLLLLRTMKSLLKGVYS